MKALVIARVALLRLVRDRSNIFFVFILPIGIVVLVGAMFGGGFTPKIGLVVDPSAGELGDDLAAAVGTRSDVETVAFASRDDVLAAVEDGTVQAGLIVGADFDAALRTGGSAEVGFVARPDAVAYQTLVDAEVARLAATIRAARLVSEEFAIGFADAFAAADATAPHVPGVEVTVRTVGEALFPSSLGQFDLGASSELVLFMFLTGLTGSAALIQTRRLGVAGRMLATPTPATTVVAGEALGRWAVVMVQGLYILFATLLLFQVDWGDPLGAAAIMILFAAVAAGTAMLMGTLFRNDQQAGGVGVMAGLGVAALGGCMIPPELFSPTMQTVSKVTPHAWALDGFAVLVREEGTILDILPQLGVLAAFAVVLVAIASYRLRRAFTAY